MSRKPDRPPPGRSGITPSPASARAAIELAAIDAKTAEIKAAIREANAALKDLHYQRGQLRAQLDAAVTEYRKALQDITQRAAQDTARAGAATMEHLARMLTGIVDHSQEVHTLVRVDRLLHHITTQLGPGDIGGEPDDDDGGHSAS